MKKSLIIILCLLSFGAMAQKNGLTINDTTFNHRGVLGYLNQISFNFQDSTCQLVVQWDAIVDTIKMDSRTFLDNVKYSDVTFWPAAAQQTKYKAKAKAYLNWRKGVPK